MRVVPIISVHDALIGYKNVVIEQNTATAIRGFSNSVRRILNGQDTGDIDVRDLSLYHIGDFNLETGEITPFVPKVLVTGTELYSNWKQDVSVNSYIFDDPFEE